MVLFKGFSLRLWKSFFCLSAWRSSIIPHTGPFGNPFLQVFLTFFFFGPFAQFFCIKLHRRLTSSRPCIPCLPPDSFLPYYKVIYNKGDPIWEPYRGQRILPCGKVLLFLCGLSRGFDRDFALKIFPQICSMLQNTKCSGSSIDISLNSDMIVSTSTISSGGK